METSRPPPQNLGSRPQTPGLTPMRLLSSFIELFCSLYSVHLCEALPLGKLVNVL